MLLPDEWFIVGNEGDNLPVHVLRRFFSSASFLSPSSSLLFLPACSFLFHIFLFHLVLVLFQLVLICFLLFSYLISFSRLLVFFPNVLLYDCPCLCFCAVLGFRLHKPFSPIHTTVLFVASELQTVRTRY